VSGAYQRVELPVGYGCSNHETIALGDGSIYWANRLGVYRYRFTPSGFSVPECVSEFTVDHGDGTSHNRTIRKKILAITDWTKCFAVFHNHEYWLYIGGGEVLVFDTINSTWAYHTLAHDMGCGLSIPDRILMGGLKPTESTTAYVYRMDYAYDPLSTTRDGLTDDGTTIEYALRSKFFDFANAANKKRFKKLFLTIYSELVSYSIDVKVNLDNEWTTYEAAIVNSISRWGEMLFGAILNTRRTNLNYPIRVRHRGKKYNLQYELRSTGAYVGWALLDVVLLMKMKELK
jgi:hypothetical protein